MADAFEDEPEQTVSIRDYLKGVEEQELVCFFLIYIIWPFFFKKKTQCIDILVWLL